MHKLEDWKRQLEQASEYGLFFDKATVREMIGVIEAQQKEILELDDSLHIARVGRRDLTAYVKELDEENERLQKALNEIVDMSPSWSANETYTNVIRIAVKALKE